MVRDSVRSRAKRLGYDLAETVTFDAITAPDGRLLNVVQALDVEAVIAASRTSFNPMCHNLGMTVLL